jgi:hypothetical protein
MKRLLLLAALALGLGLSAAPASAFPTLTCQAAANEAHYWGYNYNGPCEAWSSHPNHKRIWTTSGCCYFWVQRNASSGGYTDSGGSTRCTNGACVCDPGWYPPPTWNWPPY